MGLKRLTDCDYLPNVAVVPESDKRLSSAALLDFYFATVSTSQRCFEWKETNLTRLLNTPSMLIVNNPH